MGTKSIAKNKGDPMPASIDLKSCFKNLSQEDQARIIEKCKSKSDQDILVSFDELQLIYLLYLNLRSRNIEYGIEKEAFHHFCQMPVTCISN